VKFIFSDSFILSLPKCATLVLWRHVAAWTYPIETEDKLSADLELKSRTDFLRSENAVLHVSIIYHWLCSLSIAHIVTDEWIDNNIRYSCSWMIECPSLCSYPGNISSRLRSSSVKRPVKASTNLTYVQLLDNYGGPGSEDITSECAQFHYKRVITERALSVNLQLPLTTQSRRSSMCQSPCDSVSNWIYWRAGSRIKRLRKYVTESILILLVLTSVHVFLFRQYLPQVVTALAQTWQRVRNFAPKTLTRWSSLINHNNPSLRCQTHGKKEKEPLYSS